MNESMHKSSTNPAHENQSRIPRRSFMIAAPASIAQPITSMAGKDAAAKIMWMAMSKPCRVLPGLESQRLPEFLCRAACKVRSNCLQRATHEHTKK
jgi:hypothetical protein